MTSEDDDLILLLHIQATLSDLALSLPQESRAQRMMRRRPSAVHAICYLAHCVCRLPQTRIAVAFNLDRSTIGYAVARIEDLRDDPDVDTILSRAEAILLGQQLPRVAPFGLMFGRELIATGARRGL